MRLRAVTEWTTSAGRRRRIRLFGAWQNLQLRLSGSARAGNGSNHWKGKGCDWASFSEFRAWSLSNGYSRLKCSLDRRDPMLGYGPNNCRWLTRSENTQHQNACRAAALAPIPWGSHPSDYEEIE